MMIVIAVVGLVAVAAVWMWLRWPRVPKGRQYSDDELRVMSDDDWQKLTEDTFRETSTSVLKVYRAQYDRVRRNIEEKHGPTIAMSEQSQRRSLKSGELVVAELKRRGVE
jgi:hypothetical protein